MLPITPQPKKHNKTRKNRKRLKEKQKVEPGTGIEPVFRVYKTLVLPLDEPGMLAGDKGIEPMSSVLETEVLPLN